MKWLANLKFKSGALLLMDNKLTDSQIKRKKQLLVEHERLSRLFVEDRFQFELEKKREIEKIINNAKSKQKDSLMKLQKNWDDTMKNSGSPHNRFILNKILFKDHVNNYFKPALICSPVKKNNEK